MNNYFKPWIGKEYRNGIGGNTILVIGVQHWCDPNFWGCKKTPHECLEKRDDACPAWNNEECRESLRAKCKDYMNKCSGNHRFLHCETRISVNDHIQSKERTKRTGIFLSIYDALNHLFKKEMDKMCQGNDPVLLTPEQKKSYWNRIVFFNYIQHYTLFYRTDGLNYEELDKNPTYDEKIFKLNLDLFPNKCPDVIIVMQERKIFDKINSILNKQNYLYIKKLSKEKYYYVMSHLGSKFQQKYANSIDEFIQYCIKGWKNDSSIARKIKVLKECLNEEKRKGNIDKGKKFTSDYIINFFPEGFLQKDNSKRPLRTRVNEVDKTTPTYKKEYENIQKEFENFYNNQKE